MSGGPSEEYQILFISRVSELPLWEYLEVDLGNVHFFCKRGSWRTNLIENVGSKYREHKLQKLYEFSQGKGRTNAGSVQGRSSTSIIWPNTSDYTAAKSPSSAPSASSASLTPAPTASTWITVPLTASHIENRSIPLVETKTRGLS